MRYSVVLICCLAICSVAVPAAHYSEEETVYRSYLAAFKALKSLDDRSFEKYLSASAQRKLADVRAQRARRACDPCPSPEQELEMAKTLRPYPASDLRPVRRESGSVVSLSYKWHELPGSGSGIGTKGTDVTLIVELVQEQGWKLKSESWVMAENPGTMRMESRSMWSY